MSDVVVVATPWDAAAATVAEVAPQLKGKVVISMANALAKVGHEFQPLVPPRGLGRGVGAGRRAPQSLVRAAMHHVPAKELGDISQPVESDVLVCSDHPVGDRLHDRHRAASCPTFDPSTPASCPTPRRSRRSPRCSSR